MDGNDNKFGQPPVAVDLPEDNEEIVLETNEADPSAAGVEVAKEDLPLETIEDNKVGDVPAGPPPGEELPLELNQVDAAGPEPEAPKIIRCEFCGQEYPTPPGKFCERCGRVMSRFHLDSDNEPPLKRCLKCGHRNQPDAAICINCGDLLYERQGI